MDNDESPSRSFMTASLLNPFELYIYEDDMFHPSGH